MTSISTPQLQNKVVTEPVKVTNHNRVVQLVEDNQNIVSVSKADRHSDQLQKGKESHTGNLLDLRNDQKPTAGTSPKVANRNQNTQPQITKLDAAKDFLRRNSIS